MKAFYGYQDGSGDYFITIDTNLCNGCGQCVIVCPQGIFTTIINDYDEEVVEVCEAQRNKIKYICASCKKEATPACLGACSQRALTHSW